MSEHGQLMKTIQQMFDQIENMYDEKIHHFVLSNKFKIELDLKNGYIGWIRFNDGEQFGLVSKNSMDIIKSWDNEIKQELIYNLEELILLNV
jgi:hypothetical protein